MKNVKFFLASHNNFINDRQLWATDNEDVEKYIRNKYKEDLEQFEEITEVDARMFLSGKVEHPPQPQIESADVNEPYPNADTLIEWMVQSAERDYNFMIKLIN